ncbi:MAG: type III polyketide synthase [Pseudomonadota bacterium]
MFGFAKALPPHRFAQDEVFRTFRDTYGHKIPRFDRIEEIFVNTGIETRYAVRPVDWFKEEQGWPERTQAYLDGADALFREAAGKALEAAGLESADVDTIVTVSSTGIATPSLEARALVDLGFRGDVRRVPVFGLGCAGGVSGLALAGRLAKAEPGSNVLLVIVELCTLSFRGDALTKSNIIATALFGDGACACVVRVDPEATGRFAIRAAAEKTWPQTLDIMGWDVDPVGFNVVLSRSIPDFVRQEVRPAIDAYLDAQGETLDSLDRVSSHPGGAKVVDALEAVLDLGQGAMNHERETLRDYGNMSSPTALFVLDSAIASGFAGRSLLMALGPGFTASLMTVEVPESAGHA